MSAPMVLLVQVVLVVIVALFVLSPLYVLRGERVRRESAGANRRRSIDEHKTRLYRTLVDLDFDRESHKISAEDHARMREELINEVVQVLAEEERQGLATPQPERPRVIVGGETVERLLEEYKRAHGSRVEAGPS